MGIIRDFLLTKMVGHEVRKTIKTAKGEEDKPVEYGGKSVRTPFGYFVGKDEKLLNNLKKQFVDGKITKKEYLERKKILEKG